MDADFSISVSTISVLDLNLGIDLLRSMTLHISFHHDKFLFAQNGVTLCAVAPSACSGSALS